MVRYAIGLLFVLRIVLAQPAGPWTGYARDAQHSGLSSIGAQRLERVKWSTPVDLFPTLSGTDLLIHYGSITITAGNTILVPVRTTEADNFRVEARNGADGALKYVLTTDYTPPPHQWTPSYSPALAPGGRLYYPGAGGTVYYRDQTDSTTGAGGQIAFYGNATYNANRATFDNTVKISTPLVADSNGNIYFGFRVLGSNPASLQGGIARISNNGTGSWISAPAAAGGDTAILDVAMNCAPGLSLDGNTLYFGVSAGDFGAGYLVSVDSRSLAPVARVRLKDPEFGADALLPDNSSASPTVGPDGDVYYGVFEANCCNNDARGWLLHFDGRLSQSKTPGAFGWDTTPTIVPASAIPSYHGASTYLLFTKYNNYANTGPGGNGQNRIAVLDPNASQRDSITGVIVMAEVITALGVTPDAEVDLPGAVREWCINNGAIDPFSKSAIANSEDGVVYRWDFTTNTLSQSVRLTAGVGEAYTPTVIGADGTAYAINDAVLFAVGQASNTSITSSHAAGFTRGQSGATYTLTVANSGLTATNGLVSVTDILPAGLTATAVGGTGWNCVQPVGPCTRSDSLPGSSVYPPITLTVNVGINTASTVTNVATVSSDGSINSVNATASDVTQVSPAGCSFSMNPSSVNLGNGSGTFASLIGSFTLTAVNCTAADTWTAVSSAPWLTATGNTSGNGATPSTVIGYAALTNSTTRSRTATISAGGQTFTVNQAGSSENQLQRVVRALYQTILGREPDPTGFQFWTGPGAPQDSSGVTLINQMADGFYRSPEFQGSGYLVLELYQAVMGRTPLFSEWQAAVQSIRAGTKTPSDMLNALDIAAGLTSDAAFVGAVIQNAYNRQATPAEISTYTAQLANSQSATPRLDLLTGTIFRSSEFQARTNPEFVDMLYFTILVRDPDSGGFSFWLNQATASPGQPGLYYVTPSTPPSPAYAMKLAIIGQAVPPNPALLGFLGSPEFQSLIQ